MKSSLHDTDLARRHRTGRIALVCFLGALGFAVLSLTALIFSVGDQTAGWVLTVWEIEPADILAPGEKLEELEAARIGELIGENLGARRVRALEAEKPFAERGKEELLALLKEEVLVPDVVKTWGFTASVFAKQRIFTEAETLAATIAPDQAFTLEFRWWLNKHFLVAMQSGDALTTGALSAILGSFFTILLTMIIAFPLGTGAAIWLEEYADDNKLTRFIQTNIYNLAGVPSIIYGMLGLTIFVRALAPITSGAVFGAAGTDAAQAVSSGGRTILSASLTLAILVLPILIINAQEAIRAVPRGLRESSYALGATKWRTIASHVLPASMDRILTGMVIAVSRALGETAPLVIIGAATYLTANPDSVFSRFTTLPIQIYQWTSRPKAEFRNVAAAAILALLVLLLTLNAGAIILRDRYRSAKR